MDKLKDALVFAKLKYANGSSEEIRISDETTMYLLSGLGYSSKEVCDIMNAVSTLCRATRDNGLI